MTYSNDPIGLAISDYVCNNVNEDIIVHSDLCDDDILPVPYLFRAYENMPPIEKKALDLCSGRILDVGAGAGCHAQHLLSKGYLIETIDTSIGAVNYLKSKGIKSVNTDFLSFKTKGFDTILMLMNGIGIAGSLKQLPTFLNHAKTLLNPGGQILCDSTDINYMYVDDEGGTWMDLASDYHGEMQFQMVYKHAKSEWFPWLYVDFEKLSEIAEQIGFNIELMESSENDHFLAKLTLK
jgi:2-polyprenyl-3-methyl-5-hydroxy-6-metoxy-1,4-benzoquinol methylase